MMKHFLPQTKTFLFLLLYITLVLFVISPDSYTHDLYGRSDSAWFFMCGKAWMNGMIPYVDFTDSKGPLLWLIYGIGYLISHYNYIGLFWISCATYAVTLYLGYKTAYLLTQGDHRKSVLAAMAMILPYFLYWCHYEIRAEDFCQPFIAGGLYCLTYSTLRHEKYTIPLTGLAIGIGLVACLLIKWSIAVMYLSFVLSQGYIAFKQKKLTAYVLSFIVGVAVLLLPFILYFIYLGNLSDFIQEYFVHTSISVKLSLMETLVTYMKEWGLTLSCYKLIYLFYGLTIYLYYKKHRELTLLPLLCCLFFLATSIRNDLLYYTTVMAPFAIFALLFLFRYMNKFYATIFVLIIGAFQARNLDMKPNLFFQQNDREAFYTAAYVMSQTGHQPTLINEGHEIGIGTPVDALPGTRYWARQNGETEEMKTSRQNDIRNGKADFVACYIHYERDKDSHFYHLLQEGGYTYYCAIPYRGDLVYLYGKPGYHLPKKELNISDKDILFKHKLF